MLLDKQSTLSDAQAITVSAPSTNVLDLGALGKASYDGGAGQAQLKHFVGLKEIPLLVQVVEAFATLTSLTITVESDDNSAFSSAKEVLKQTIAVADLKAGYKPNFRQLPIIKERYVRLNYTVNGADATAGKITAGLVASVDGQN